MRRFLPRHVALAITDAHNPKTPPEATNSRAQVDKFRCSTRAST